MQFEGHLLCSLSPYFLLGCFHMGPPEASVLAALSGGRTTLLLERQQLSQGEEQLR